MRAPLLYRSFSRFQPRTIRAIRDEDKPETADSVSFSSSTIGTVGWSEFIAAPYAVIPSAVEEWSERGEQHGRRGGTATREERRSGE